jgi:hypothetical protein
LSPRSSEVRETTCTLSSASSCKAAFLAWHTLVTVFLSSMTSCLAEGKRDTNS